MQYADAVEAFFPARPDAVLPLLLATPTPARRLRDALEPVAMNDVWSPAVHARTAELGLDFLLTYVYSRGSALGDAHPGVVAAAFAWFEPGLVAALYDAARASVPREGFLAVRDAGVVEGLRAVLGPDVESVADRLADAVEQLEAAGRPFFAGLLSRGRPEDPHLRLWWACDAAREHRGDSHVAAALAAGFDPVEMNVLTELWLGMPLLSYTATRAWPPEATDRAVAGLRERGLLDGDTLSEAGRQARGQVEAATDRQVGRLVELLGDDLDPLCARLDAWGEQLVAARHFPADVLKRAAG